MTDESRSELKTCLETIGDSISYVQFCEKCESWLNSCGDFDSGRRISELSRLPARFVSSVEERAELEKRKRLIIQILDCRHDQARDSVPGENVEDLLEKFATFVQLLNRPAHKKSTFAANPVVLKNEYDLQHLLYAYLRPVYTNLRPEHTLDDGYLAVRADFSVENETIIETKFTRDGMTEAKLAEEIAADSLRYPAAHIIFLIADPARIIADPEQFRRNYERKVPQKMIRILILS